MTWIRIPGDKNYSVDPNAVPTYDPSPKQIEMSKFKQSLRNLGSEYPYDPVTFDY